MCSLSGCVPSLDAQSDECPARQPQVTEPLTSAQPGAATTDAPAKTLTGKQDDALLAVLNRFTEDVTEKARSGRIDPVFGRDTEIRQMVDILSRRRKNNPILVGEPGVGKTALVEGLALRITEGNVPDSLKTVHIRTLDLGLLQAGAGVKGEFEQRLKNVIDAVQKSPEPVLLFIDEAHTIIGAGNQAGGADAANLLKPALARGELRTIAATTWSEYKQYFERDAALERRFGAALRDGAQPGEASAQAMRDYLCGPLSGAVYSLVMTLDVELCVLAGIVPGVLGMQLCTQVSEALRAALPESTPVRVEPSVSADAGVIGAAATVFERSLDALLGSG